MEGIAQRGQYFLAVGLSREIGILRTLHVEIQIFLFESSV